jgi:hypothetical protein
MTLGRQLVSQSVRDDLISSSQKKIAIQLRRLGVQRNVGCKHDRGADHAMELLLLCRRKLLEGCLGVFHVSPFTTTWWATSTNRLVR